MERKSLGSPRAGASSFRNLDVRCVTETRRHTGSPTQGTRARPRSDVRRGFFVSGVLISPHAGVPAQRVAADRDCTLAALGSLRVALGGNEKSGHLFGDGARAL